MKNICLNCSKEFDTTQNNDYFFCCNECKSALLDRGKKFLLNEIAKSLSPLVCKLAEVGAEFKAIKKANRVEAYWKFSRAMFWHTQNFHEGETNKFKTLIHEFFHNSRDIDGTFIELVERACLAKRYT